MSDTFLLDSISRHMYRVIMPRNLRLAQGGMTYHVLNRANARERLFLHDGDYKAFERVLTEAAERFAMRVLSYCVMPNHWHLVLWPRNDGDLSVFMAWLTATHSHRWRTSHRSVGFGHVYQGRYKSFPVQNETHLHTVCRYVERNPARARLVVQAQDWRWGSLWRHMAGNAEDRSLLTEWPVQRPTNWLDLVNAPLPELELVSVRTCVLRNRPLGAAAWQIHVAARLGLEATLRARGRPRKGV